MSNIRKTLLQAIRRTTGNYSELSENVAVTPAPVSQAEIQERKHEAKYAIEKRDIESKLDDDLVIEVKPQMHCPGIRKMAELQQLGSYADLAEALAIKYNAKMVFMWTETDVKDFFDGLPEELRPHLSLFHRPIIHRPRPEFARSFERGDYDYEIKIPDGSTLMYINESVMNDYGWEAPSKCSRFLHILVQGWRGYFGMPLPLSCSAIDGDSCYDLDLIEQFHNIDMEARNDGRFYGNLIVIGYKEYRVDGSNWIAVGPKNDSFTLARRLQPNGLRECGVVSASSLSSDVAADNIAHPSQYKRLSHFLRIDYRDGARPEQVVYGYCPDREWDMYQIGRMSVAQNDVVIRGPLHQDGNGILCGPVSRYACRILCRRNPPHDCYMFAAGFSDKNEAFISESAPKFYSTNDTTTPVVGTHNYPRFFANFDDDAYTARGERIDSTMTHIVDVDALTTFGVRVFSCATGEWSEVSARGRCHALRPETNICGSRTAASCKLENGDIIDLGGVQLMFETMDAYLKSPVLSVNEVEEKYNSLKPQCPVLMHTVRFEVDTIKRRQLQRDRVPYVFPACGHVHAYSAELRGRPCPMCRTPGPFVEIIIDINASIDKEIPTHVFNPCGHLCSEQTAEYWSKLPLPDNAPPQARYRPVCPYCAHPLRNRYSDNKPYSKLIFQEKMFEE